MYMYKTKKLKRHITFKTHNYSACKIFCRSLISFKIHIITNFFQECHQNIRQMSFDPDQVGGFVSPDLGPNPLQKL